jgi:hypothetical protein
MIIKRIVWFTVAWRKGHLGWNQWNHSSEWPNCLNVNAKVREHFADPRQVTEIDRNLNGGLHVQYTNDIEVFQQWSLYPEKIRFPLKFTKRFLQCHNSAVHRVWDKQPLFKYGEFALDTSRIAIREWDQNELRIPRISESKQKQSPFNWITISNVNLQTSWGFHCRIDLLYEVFHEDSLCLFLSEVEQK